MNIKHLARQAKDRLRTGFWTDSRNDLQKSLIEAEKEGKNQTILANYLCEKLKCQIRGEEQDEFYLKVKQLLEEEGEVSDAIGRLTDQEYYQTLGYDEGQRYLLELSNKYLKALERYRKEKEMLV